MYLIEDFKDIRGNNVIIYSICTLLERKSFPKLSIMAGMMGVGKTSVAQLAAKKLDKSEVPVKSFNFGMPIELSSLQEEVFSLNPTKPRVFIFEELHGLNRASQNALLQMFDNQPSNVYVICTTTELQKIIPTIRSRAQVWEFKLLSEKQLMQLLEDYLVSEGKTLSEDSKRALLKACRGVPRDLLKHADLALDGNFNAEQLNELLGNVSDALLYSIFCSLRSKPADFVSHIEELMDEVSSSKIQAMNDFWLRFLLERSGSMRSTIGRDKIKTLDSLYTYDDLQRITKVLLRARQDTLLLELVNLNLTLSKADANVVVGQQRSTAEESRRESRVSLTNTERKRVVSEGAKVTADAIKEIKV